MLLPLCRHMQVSSLLDDAMCMDFLSQFKSPRAALLLVQSLQLGCGDAVAARGGRMTPVTFGSTLLCPSPPPPPDPHCTATLMVRTRRPRVWGTADCGLLAQMGNGFYTDWLKPLVFNTGNGVLKNFTCGATNAT